jgi:hypothetical protein
MLIFLLSLLNIFQEQTAEMLEAPITILMFSFTDFSMKAFSMLIATSPQGWWENVEKRI